MTPAIRRYYVTQADNLERITDHLTERLSRNVSRLVAGMSGFKRTTLEKGRFLKVPVPSYFLKSGDLKKSLNALSGC